jgi:hypothetical protein
MKAEQVRSIPIIYNSKHELQQGLFLREIAAQLAELVEVLSHARSAVGLTGPR